MLPHQSRYMQAPYLFPGIRYFFLCCGYGSGKTRANAMALLYAVKNLQGKKDRAGDYARIIVAGYTLAHLNKTLLVYIRQYLDNSKTSYTENKKDNFFTIGTVTVFIVPIENPENIFGFDAWCVFVEELDELTEDKALETVRALSERCRQQITDCRPPFLAFGSTSQGQKGLYRIYNHFKKSGVGFVLIRGRTQDNWYLPKEQIRDMLRIYTPEEKRVFMDGEFLAIAKGRVLGDFDWERNYLSYDLDTGLLPSETVYIGMDFNCVAEGSLVYTLRGCVPIENVTSDDKVLTRNGFQRVLTKMCSGVNTVSRCYGVDTTRGHIFRTPEGDMAQWQVKKYGGVYCLRERLFSTIRLDTTIVSALVKASELCLTGTCMFDTRTGRQEETGKCRRQRNTLLNREGMGLKTFFTWLYGSTITDRFRKGAKYIMSMAVTIIGLNFWFACRQRNTHVSIKKSGINTIPACGEKALKKDGQPGVPGIIRKKVDAIMLRYSEWLGRKADILLYACAQSVEKLLTQKSLRHGIARSVSRKYGGGLNGRNSRERKRGLRLAVGAEALAETVLSVANLLSEHIRQDIAENIEAIGNDLVLRKSDNRERKTRVYDLEVENAHEYFVNGTLVHNTGYNRASAYIVREGVIYGIKYYDFPDPQDAPSVFRHDFPEQRIIWLPDVTIKDSFPQFSKELRRHGIQIGYRKKSPLVEDSCFLANKLFKLERLQICKIAGDLAEA
jgi:hypothetical protein